jgi:hypothetical protein
MLIARKGGSMPIKLFKLEYTVRDLFIPPEEILSFDYGGPHKVRIEIRAPSEEEQAKGFGRTDAFCIATLEIEPNEAVESVFERIEANQIYPPETKEQYFPLEYPTPEGLRIRLPNLSGFPENFQSFIKNVTDELSNFANRTVSVLRWRVNELGPHNPISTRGLSWSIDGKFWHPAPVNWHVKVSVKGSIQLVDGLVAFVQKIVASDGNEPIYHDLYREAWEQCSMNPRSSLIMGMAALEISVKQCISVLVPDAEWLASNLPTPPIIQILTDYIPQLPVKNKIKGKVLPPPAEILDEIKKGVSIRNKLAHTGEINPNPETVEKILISVHDILFMMDFYSGFDWAFEFISPKTREKLKKD